MNIRPTSATLMLSAAFGCTIDLGGTTTATTATTATTDGPTTDPGDTTTAPDTSGTTGEPTPTTGEATTNVGPTTGTSTGDTEGDPVWCNGFDPNAVGLTVHNNADLSIMDGSELAAECGGQGVLMIPIFPHFGGFMPAGDAVTFDVVLDIILKAQIDVCGYGGYETSDYGSTGPDSTG